MYSTGGQPYQVTAASSSGALALASSVSAPPMQKPTQPTLDARVLRNCAAPRMSCDAASPKSSPLMR